MHDFLLATTVQCHVRKWRGGEPAVRLSLLQVCFGVLHAGINLAPIQQYNINTVASASANRACDTLWTRNYMSQSHSANRSGVSACRCCRHLWHACGRQVPLSQMRLRKAYLLCAPLRQSYPACCSVAAVVITLTACHCPGTCPDTHSRSPCMCCDAMILGRAHTMKCFGTQPQRTT